VDKPSIYRNYIFIFYTFIIKLLFKRKPNIFASVETSNFFVQKPFEDDFFKDETLQSLLSKKSFHQ